MIPQFLPQFHQWFGRMSEELLGIFHSTIEFLILKGRFHTRKCHKSWYQTLQVSLWRCRCRPNFRPKNSWMSIHLCSCQWGQLHGHLPLIWRLWFLIVLAPYWYRWRLLHVFYYLDHWKILRNYTIESHSAKNPQHKLGCLQWYLLNWLDWLACSEVWISGEQFSLRFLTFEPGSQIH